MVRSTTDSNKTFRLIMLKPPHYDDDGQVIQWLRSAIPSNSLAVLNGLAIDCAERKVLGDDVDLVLSTYDEANTRIKPQDIIRQIRQNRITEYRRMLLDWESIETITYAGYILGFPTDTPESIIRDIRIIQRELPLYLLEFFYLTPLPGSEDHQKLWQKGVWMDGDLEKYDLDHITVERPLMSRQDWERVCKLAWETHYTPERMETVMRRAEACGISAGKMMFLMVWFIGCITVEKIHPLEGDFFWLKLREDRRPTLRIESPFLFYPRYA